MEEYKYKFSVVIPVYNVGKFLEETIESVVNQTIGFEENIQIIFVNDGSTDNSEEICLKYKEKYPNNIIYIKQENAGVSAARNNGKQYVEGKYTNFLDGDDKWKLDVFKKVWRFFENNYSKINLLSCRMKFFDARDDYHTLDYKFKETRIIDILEDYNLIQLHITSCFIKSAILNKYNFDTNLKYAEDSKFVAQIIMGKRKYGVLASAIHYYRKRADETSAVQNKEKSKAWYLDTPEYMYKDIMKKSIKKYGIVIPYIQYMIMYDMQWRLNRQIPEFLSEEEKTAYIENICEILRNIEDYIICEQKKLKAEYKCYALSLKYGRDIRNELTYIKNKLYFNNLCVYNINNTSTFSINIININKDEIELEGQVNCILPDNMYEIYIQANNNEKYPLKLKDTELNNSYCLTGIYIKSKRYSIKLPLNEISEFKFIFKYKDVYTKRMNLHLKAFAKLHGGIESSYYAKGKYVVSTSDDIIKIEKNKKGLIRQKEKAYLKDLRKLGKRKIIFYRLMYRIYRKFIKRKIWLICDKLPDRSDDSAKFLFKYIVKKNNKKIRPIYIVSKSNKEYKELKKLGEVIKPYSFKHKLYFLLCKNYISSHAIEDNINPFKTDIQYVKDLYNSNFVFLQHGIIKDDMSAGLHKFVKNMAIFVTSTNPEYESIVNGNYLYTKKQVKLTGLPRYDELYNNRNKNIKKTILILPTWRKYIKESYDIKTFESVYFDKFKETEFYKFYNGLINDERIINALKENGYRIKLCLHPVIKKQCVDFQGNEYVDINQGAVDYPKEFTENSLMITDYSSVFFDFAYLRKPVVYTQFDYEQFFDDGQYKEGYFEYERDGFGPVCYDYETAVNEIVNLINRDCKLDEKYAERIENTYAYYDNHNCRRVYEEIKKL